MEGSKYGIFEVVKTPEPKIEARMMVEDEPILL
jgi:hypothetical protein